MKQLVMMMGLMVAATTGLIAQTYKPVDDQSKVKFSIKNVGINTGGDFKGLQGTIVFDVAHPDKSAIELSVDVSTVNTASETRDNHLRKEEYFDAAKYPRISFKSDKITAGKKDMFTITGKLTIKGVTKDISFPFKATAKDDGLLFEGEFKINRRDFSVGGNSVVLSDNVNVSLSIFGRKQ